MKLYTRWRIAKELGLTESEIQSMVNKGQIKSGIDERGLFRLEETAREIIAAMRKSPESRRVVDYKEERALLVRAQRENAELDLKLRRGDLHKTEDVEYATTKILMNFKARIRAIPSRAAPMVAKMDNTADIFDVLSQMTDEALEELSDFDRAGDKSE